ncbi:hypothetical protein SMACR_00707 [Sordaria macrospora]|uniref:WGS project CABT00000000 data, contig 2.2 n=2 Tax=Sordaria macrospora TaxID=5147 RepID=F7VMV2_SORMK|nr:uncharacterized protein SMAC_00707 [Sordaria macrospora k-hell]KAA8633933.1 hypothetical protein SMACR_00707 [Sordaria macrospora]WPJ66834.1 hypothetical protein SMAC4_00707 [Sordaria macrospora]CCC06681.1 unnamed protein product [Sordaria macrospora k-hell]
MSITPILLLLSFLSSKTAAALTLEPRGSGPNGAEEWTWEHYPPASVATGGTNSGAQAQSFSFAKWVEDARNGKAMSPKDAIAAYKAGQHTKRDDNNNDNPLYDDDDDGDELPPWYYTYGPGAARNTTRPLVEDTFTLVSGIAYHPEMYYIGKDEGKDIIHQSNTARLNVRSVTGQKYGVKGTDIARAGGLIMDYCTWKGRSGGGEYAWGNGYLYVTLEHTGKGEKTMQENLMIP